MKNKVNDEVKAQDKSTKVEPSELLVSFVNAVRVATKDQAKAIRSDASAGQKGAWFIACAYVHGCTIDEALSVMRGALKDAKLPLGKIETCRKLVGHAVSLRTGQATDDLPKGAEWHSVKYYGRIEDLANRTSSQMAGIWAKEHAKVLAKVTNEKGIPFVKHYCQKFDIAKEDLTKEVDVKAWDRELLKLTKSAPSGATAEATSDQLVLAFVKRSALLKVALERISQADRFSLTEMIESVNQEMRD